MSHEPIEIRVNDASPLALVKAMMELHRKEGITCPACGQFAKEYRRTIHHSMASALVKLTKYQDAAYSFFAYFDITAIGLTHRELADFGKLAHWGLVTRMPASRADGSSRTGKWRVTEAGRSFVHNGRTVQKYAVIYNGELIELQGELITIKGIKNFDYAALMAGE